MQRQKRFKVMAMNELRRPYERALKRVDVPCIVDVYDSVNETYLGRMVNVHDEGLMIMTASPIDEDKLYQVDLHMPDDIGGGKLHLGIDCLWVRPNDDSETYWAGCKIIDISPEGREQVTALLKKIGA